VDESTARAVRERAGGRCEYCRLPASLVSLSFEIEHVIARQHGGTGAPGNLAFACLHCNRYKGPNLSGIDPVTSRIHPVRLFHPRRHRWSYHFAFDGPRIVGWTAIGRATVRALNMNSPIMVALRTELLAERIKLV
jgi:hypothetical protein